MSAALAAALENNDDRREKENLHSGKIRMVGLFMAGNISTDILPQPTAEYEECCAKTNKEEKSGSLKRMLDSNNKNKARPLGDPIVIYHNINHHGKNMCKSMAIGDLSQEPVVDLDAKSSQVNI